VLKQAQLHIINVAIPLLGATSPFSRFAQNDPQSVS